MRSMQRPTVLFAVNVVLVVGCGKGSTKKAKGKESKSVQAKSDSSETKTEPPREPSLADKMSEATTLSEAVSLLKPHMENSRDKYSKAANALMKWALSHDVKFEDITALEETSYKEVMKDPFVERGKRLCARTRIIQIHAHHTGDKTWYTGVVQRGYSRVYRFMAFGSTGDLVQDKRAKFCGVVIGRHSYKNSGGGTTHGVELVGMFDLKENHRAE